MQPSRVALKNSLLLEIVHAPRPDQFCLRVGHEKVATAALVQAGVDEAQRFGALIRFVKIDSPVVKDLERGRRSGIAVAVVLSIILTAAEWGLVFTLCWRRRRVVINHGQPVGWMQDLGTQNKLKWGA
jgi:hypothetical protein